MFKRLAYCLNKFLVVKELIGALNKEEGLVGAFSGHCATSRWFVRFPETWQLYATATNTRRLGRRLCRRPSGWWWRGGWGGRPSSGAGHIRGGRRGHARLLRSRLGVNFGVPFLLVRSCKFSAAGVTREGFLSWNRSVCYCAVQYQCIVKTLPCAGEWVYVYLYCLCAF